MPIQLSPDHIGLYIHVPFCVRKCRYCDFASRPLCETRHLVDAYLQALAREAEMRRHEISRPIHSVYIGGGTPTALSPAQLNQLWETAVAPFPLSPEAEVSIEANPGTLTPAHADLLAHLPITRISLGAQSFQPEELARLGRIHTPEDVADSVHLMRAAGIPQLNLDLMYGLPGQTVQRWEETLQQALALAPDHLSCYALILEQETPLAEEIAAGFLSLPGEEEEEGMAAVTAEFLVRHGMAQYEVSNAARPGAECRHNLGYWLGRDYLGLGPSAVSAMQGVRWRNAAGIMEYTSRMQGGVSVVEYVERLSAPQRLMERVMLGLRLRGGFNLAAAEVSCGCVLAVLAGRTMDELTGRGWLERHGDTLRLTPAGFPLANHIVATLMAASTEGSAD